MNGVTYKDFPIIEVAHRLGIHIDRSTLGRSEVEAYCPFCNGSKNHLFLNSVSNQFFCQKCREGGNSVTLYAKMHGISNREAVDELDREAKTYPFPDTKVRSEPVSDNLALLERRHDVYYDLLCELQLNDAHLLDLLGRGLSLTRIGQNMYRSMPVRQTEKNKIAQRLASKHDLRGVPGFYTDLVSGEWCLAGQAGILVPFCTAAGYIQGLQIRLDNKSKRKYRWLSSNPKHQHKDGTQKYPNGTAARTWVHITGDHCSSTAHITEGAVKGDVSSFLDGNSLYICVPGVSSINHLLPAIRSLPNIERVESLFDMDQIEDEKYSKALLHMIKMLKSLGIPVEQRQWNPDYNGVDEYKAYCRAAQLAA